MTDAFGTAKSVLADLMQAVGRTRYEILNVRYSVNLLQ